MARLTWYRGWLRLGRLAIARMAEDMDGWRYRVSRPRKWSGAASQPNVSDAYERAKDCRADCEAEVRRLLKEAGVEVEVE